MESQLKEGDEAKREQLDKHIYSAPHGSTEGTYITMKQYTKSNTQEYNKTKETHVCSGKETKAMHERRSTTE